MENNKSKIICEHDIFTVQAKNSTTSITKEKLLKIQSPIINTVLTKLGFNRHMPQPVVFAPTTLGGLGLLDLYTEQGCNKTIIIVSHIRSRSPLYLPLIILIESYQTLAGMTTCAFDDTTNHVYVHSPWLSCVRTFLQLINAQLLISEIQTIHCIRENDQAIMNHPEIHKFTKSQLESVNACRTFLQVTTLAEFTSCKGTLLLIQAVKGTVDNKGSPLLWQISRFTLKCPYQPRPPQKSWYVWK
jgi:hypothetical protein